MTRAAMRRLLTSVAFAAFAAPPASLQTPVWRMNCGGEAVVLPSGALFLADQEYSSSSHAGYILGSKVTAQLPIGGAANPHAALHGSARVGWRCYAFDVPNGRYLVRLHFAEIDLSVHGPSLRRFDVSVEGAPVVVDLDVAARVGIQYGLELVAATQVLDGRLDVEASVVKDPSLLNAIEVWAWPADAAPPPSPTGVSAKPGFHRNIVTWDPAASPDIAQFIVSAAPAPSGPFTPIAWVSPAPPRFLDEGASAVTETFYRVHAVDAFGNVGLPSAVVSSRARTNSESSLRTYAITINPENWKWIDKKVITDPKFTVPAKFSYGGKTHDVQVRYRGGNSRRYSKKSWKVKFPKGAPFEGRRDLNLKAHYSDFSLAREPMANVLYHAVGHAVSTRRSVRLDVNGIDQGVFDEIEEVDESYLMAHGRDAGGSLYEVNSNYALLPTPDEYPVFYEKETNESSGYVDLIEFLTLVNESPAALFEREILDRFDVEGYLSYLAVLGWLADLDSIDGNARLLHDHALDRWEVIAWDTDVGFGLAPFALTPKPDFSIVFGKANAPETPKYGWNVLKSRVLDVRSFRWRYCEKLRALAEGAASPPALVPAIDAFAASIAMEASADVRKWGWESDSLFSAGPALLQSYVASRSAFVLAAIPGIQPPLAPTEVWINEVLVHPLGGDLDETGEPAPWVELYNSSTSPLDAAGWKLATSTKTSSPWAIPVHAIVPPGGFLRVWLDGKPEKGPLHASVTLDMKGGNLFLLAADGETILDFVSLVPQVPQVSYGRFPDGGPFFHRMTPTGGQPNTLAELLPPLLTWVEAVPASPTAADSITISCQVKSAEGVTSVVLRWRNGGGAFTSLPMAPVGADRYEATIPAQAPGSTVAYFVEATATSGLAAKSPPLAPDALWSVHVQGSMTSLLRINEVMADNGSTIADEAGEFDDWIEIYNGSTAAIDVGGMYLTDNLGVPKKWKFPAATTIPAKGTLLVWADGEPSEGPLHASFKLDKLGEAVGLFDTDAHQNAMLDGFTFGPQGMDVSLGLVPDGSTLRVKIHSATPGAPNVPAPGASFAFAPEDSANDKVGILVTGSVQVGGVMTVSVSGAAPGGTGFLLFGTGTLAVPVPGAGLLLTLPEHWVSFATTSSGSASVSVPIPNDPVLVNLVVYTQAFAFGAGLSNGLSTTLAAL